MSLRQCSQAGFLHWGSFWAPPLVQWTACGQLWTSRPVTPPGLAGACGVLGAQKTEPRPPPWEAPQPRRRPLCSSRSNHAGDLSSEGKGTQFMLRLFTLIVQFQFNIDLSFSYSCFDCLQPSRIHCDSEKLFTASRLEILLKGKVWQRVARSKEKLFSRDFYFSFSEYG